MRLFMRRDELPPLSGMSLETLLYTADTSPDPRRVYEALLLAEAMAPEDLSIKKRLLLHGRLHERSPKSLDLSVIKCRLLYAFEHPEKLKPGEEQTMIHELMQEPRLLHALALAVDPEAFLAGYLQDLSKEYMRIFVAGDKSHVPQVFGLSFGGSLHRYLALPARDILLNMLSSPHLEKTRQVLLAKAFYQAFYEHVGGQVRELDSLLGQDVCTLLR